VEEVETEELFPFLRQSQRPFLHIKFKYRLNEKFPMGSLDTGSLNLVNNKEPNEKLAISIYDNIF
jgi:hypothetical protein